jgi:hypothetical protein
MEEGQREYLKRGKEDFKYVDGGKINELGKNCFEQVGPLFAEFRFVTKDPLPTNPLAAVKFVIIINASVFEFGGTIRNFPDKREKPIGRG